MRDNTFRQLVRDEVDAIPLPPVQRWVPQRTRAALLARLRAVPVALVAVLVLAVGASAITVVLPRVFGLGDPTAVEILQSGRATELGITQEAAGVSIRLDRVYVDADRLVIQFSIPSVPADPGQTVPAPLTTGGSLVLTDANGQVLRVLRGQESPFIRDARWTGQPLVGVYSFEPPVLPTDTDRLALRLTIGELRGVGAGTSASPVTRVRGPWHFDFEVPISR